MADILLFCTSSTGWTQLRYIDTRVFPLFTGPDRPDRVWGTFVQGSIFVSMIICVYLHLIRWYIRLVPYLYQVIWWLCGLGRWEVRGSQTGSQTGSCLTEGSSVRSPLAPLAPSRIFSLLGIIYHINTNIYWNKYASLYKCAPDPVRPVSPCE